MKEWIEAEDGPYTIRSHATGLAIILLIVSHRYNERSRVNYLPSSSKFQVFSLNYSNDIQSFKRELQIH